MKENLLLKDICARLPYDVEAQVVSNIEGESKPFIENKILTFNDVDSFIKMEGVVIGIKPFLRPMASMTEKEKEQFEELTYNEHEDFETTTGRRMILATDSDTGYGSEYFSKDISEIVDWLNCHHIDYRGLIKLGLALEAPKNMYN